MKKFSQAVVFILMLGTLSACLRAAPVVPESVPLIQESSVVMIALAGPAADSGAEISGMAWCGERLVLLPQYPMDYADALEPGYVFSIRRPAVDSFLSGKDEAAILPDRLPFDSKGIEHLIPGFEGFEAIVFHKDDFYVTIESRQDGGMMGYLARGSVSGGCEKLTLIQEEPAAIQPQADLGNMSDETLVIYDDQLYSIYEANGINVNPDPVANRFDLSLEKAGTLALPNIEYRITDATQADSEGEFWAINFFFPGDTKLKPGPDQIAAAYGLGVSHQDQAQVERLITLRIERDQITLVDTSPIYLKLSGVISRNWEGVVRYGDGFLLVTDEHPATILALVENLSDEDSSSTD